MSSPAPCHRHRPRPRLRVGVIGAGRVGAVVAARMREAGHEIVAASGSSDASRTRIETLLPGVPAASPHEVARSCDLLLLTVPDDALVALCDGLVARASTRPGQVLVHTSGRHGSAALAPTGVARVIAMHPAMTFTGTDVDLRRLDGCMFGLTAADRERELAEGLVADLGGRPMWIAEEHRALYHAALAHGANHLVTLVSQSAGLLREAGADDPSAVLRPLLEAALDNVLTYGDAALTGPVVRGDTATVQAHVDVLSGAPPATLDTYLTLAKATAGAAVTDGRLDSGRALQIGQVLTDTGRDDRACVRADAITAAGL